MIGANRIRRAFEKLFTVNGQHGLSYRYASLAGSDAERNMSRPRVSRRSLGIVLVTAILLGALLVTAIHIFFGTIVARTSCDTVQDGYQCQPQISHYWGQYSPYFAAPSDISAEIPYGCSITFAQVLSRHGARDPTRSKTMLYKDTISKMQNNVKEFTGLYRFLADYRYALGADQLTVYGQQEMVNAGMKFYKRYGTLARHQVPFVRASSQTRVVTSAQNWTQGYHRSKAADQHATKDDAYPYEIVAISEVEGSNNTLSHGLCSHFENGPDSNTAAIAQATWANIFVPPIQARLNADLPGANLTQADTIHIMD
ncbi:hypothetical protein LTR66_009037, partial [Elasticomyces elasticus]